MMWGVVFLSIFMVIAIAAAVLDILKRNIPVWLDILGVIASLCVAAYTGALLGACQTYPLWNNALLPILFLISAMSAGAASVLLIAVIKHADEFILRYLIVMAAVPLTVAVPLLIAGGMR